MPQKNSIKKEYEAYQDIASIFPINSLGIAAGRDSLCFDFVESEFFQKLHRFLELDVEAAREKFSLPKDSRDWQVGLAQKDLKNTNDLQSRIVKVQYRPFDYRHTFYSSKSKGFLCMPRNNVMDNLFQNKNLGLISNRNLEGENTWNHIFCSKHMTQLHSLSIKEVNYFFPLYLYPKQGVLELGESKKEANLAPKFLEEVCLKTLLEYTPDGGGNLETTFGPEDVMHYIYAVLHCPAYRTRYAEFLKIDFPRVPITSNPKLFVELVVKGAELVRLHLLETPTEPTVHFPHAGLNVVDKPRYVAGTNKQPGQVFINDTQCFTGVAPEVWAHRIGSYQVLEKWLKDRKGRVLDFDDITHYMRICTTLERTQHLMLEIDEVVKRFGGFPLQ